MSKRPVAARVWPGPAPGAGTPTDSSPGARAELAGVLDRWATEEGENATAIPDLTLWRFSNRTGPMHALQQPGVYVVAQGRKQVSVGGETYVYDPTRYLAVSLHLPVIGQVIEATPDEPYLCLALRVDARALAALLLEQEQPVRRGGGRGRAIFVSTLQAPLLDALLRLVRLLDAAADLAVLGPLVLREIHYRLLQDEQGGRLAEMALGDGRLRRVSAAILWIQEHFSEALPVGEIARRAHMSTSALHANFRAATGLTPLQYQKRLRLQEARGLLMAGATSAESVAYTVGYASASQFSREYARLFGHPPRRDADRLRRLALGEEVAP